MGRQSSFRDADIYAAVGATLAGAGKVRFQDLVRDTGLSVGSLYHRFGSREVLMAETWLDAVEAFQTRFFAALESEGDARAGERAALVTPQFCRDEKARALVLCCCRRSEFVNAETPSALRRKVADANLDAERALCGFARRSGLSLEALRLGLVAFPLGAVRLYLPSRDVPLAVDGYVAAAYRAAIRVED